MAFYIYPPHTHSGINNLLKCCEDWISSVIYTAVYQLNAHRRDLSSVIQLPALKNKGITHKTCNFGLLLKRGKTIYSELAYQQCVGAEW